MTKKYPFFYGIKFTLFALFGLFFTIIVAMGGAFFWAEFDLKDINKLTSEVAEASLLLNEANNLEKDFFLFETINADFYANEKSSIIDQHNQLILEAEEKILAIRKSPKIKNSPLASELFRFSDLLRQLEKKFNDLTALTLKKGFKDWGIIGRMRNYIHEIEHSPLSINQGKMLMIRRHEKDYLLRKQPQYLAKLAAAVEVLREEIGRLPASEEKVTLLANLGGYQQTFSEMVKVDEEIGYQQDSGIKAELFELTQNIDKELKVLESLIGERATKLQKNLTFLIFALTVGFVLITIVAGYYVNKKLGRPIAKLSQGINEAVQSEFKQDVRLKLEGNKDEIGQISEDVDFLYRKVQSYTSELLMQKEEIEVQNENMKAVNTQLEEKTELISAKNFELENQNEHIHRQKSQIEENYHNIQLLTVIGHEITSNLNIEDIVSVVYKNVTEMMDVNTFAIGLYQEDKNALQFYGTEQGAAGKVLKGVENLKTETLSTICFKQSREIIIQNIDEEYKKYLENKPRLSSFLNSKSIIYLPLNIKGRTIGVISVQSETIGAYDEFEINIFRNLATYTAIALENAQIYQQIEKQQGLLSEQADNLKVANEEISKKNHSLTSSINYARRIQSTMLPKTEVIEKHLPESFVLFKPRDIVSGDFYFFSTIPLFDGKGGKLMVIAAADCTGHGVPGAFTSMVGSGLLDSIINRKGVVGPKEILSKLNIGILQTFKQKESENKDGMDISLAVIDPQKKKLFFGGAKNPLVYVQDDEVHLIKGDRYPVGGGILATRGANYTTHEIDLSIPTTFYLFSDGYQDQFGGKDCRKLTGKRFRNQLLDIHELPMQMQKQALDEFIVNWMNEGCQTQLDDILVMGIKLDYSEK